MSQKGKRAETSDFCGVCGHPIFGETLEGHRKSCAEELLNSSRESSDPFNHWKTAVALDHAKRFEDSEAVFKKTAQLFFDYVASAPGASKSLFEYSTLMDAFSRVERGRNFMASEQFTQASQAIPEACEILRSTLHYAFLAPYITACATLETVAGMNDWDEDKFQGYRTANAFLEQAKFALSFRDETNPLVKTIDACLKYSISCALSCEASSLLSSGSKGLATEREFRAKQIRLEYELLAVRSKLVLDEMEFLPQRDFLEREESPLVLAFPYAENLWLVNSGKHPAKIEKVGNLDVNFEIAPMSSAQFELSRLTKGKIRVEYFDSVSREKHNEGCMTLV